MTVAFYTLGCKVNQYETQALEQLFTGRGHTLAPFEGEADVYIINTCTVTAVSDKKSRQTIRQARKRSPEALVAVCGCYPQTHQSDMADLPVDLVAGTGDRLGFVELVEQAWAERQEKITALDDVMKRRVFEPLPAGGLEGRTRAMLKVEDGCVNFCTYCIIPYARGPVRSLPLASAAAEAERLAAEGYKELVLTGIEISSWGLDLEGKPELIDLIEAVCAAAPDCRIRLGSLEPRTITEAFCQRAVNLPNLCPHFHLSLQSGCDATLKRMNRKYDTARFMESVGLIWDYFQTPVPAITADMIVGFPGETDEEFCESIDFAKRCAFSSMHIFPYSRRPGTPAASMPGQVPKAVKEERAREAAEVAARMEHSYLEQWDKVIVLFEEERDGLWWGHTRQYCKVGVPSGENLHNQLRKIQITAVEKGCLLGELLNLENK
ncbi:tRNA (N(6)-L-threonylcarbamoyladenosine(37)-C(2))-methylthiotransferase MtaB [Flintibacter muris]|uniref:tRNA (N(6)-L-threonylcarbamoyladenosine(37)-C(2))- methylthiotransferase MtaB n=1 Tax=Flintibacter muris TaxID=2941327 RepID=UPI00203E7295|nr:tRNA (N(6)-L-threonylcarbamoyladenosine(37)-C(2))-methylthiotransferase MtaB [Flintibacter muris]